MRRNHGITLIALTVTIIILLILASVTTYSGISTIQSSKLNKYKQELEIMQSEVNLLYEKYSTEIEAGQEIEIGEELSNSEQENDAFAGAEESDKTGYRLFTKETLEELGIEGVENEYLVNIAKRQVISIEPFGQDGKVYYTLAQLSEKNTIEEGIERGEIEFTVETNLSETGLEVTVSDIKYSKYVGKGNIFYQKVGSETWRTLVTDYREDTYTFTISEVGEYNVKIVDAAGVEKIADTPIIVESGNYLLDNTMYFDTLVEAVAVAQDGSIIQVVKNTEETESVTIDKSITLDTNSKTIKYIRGKININEGKDVEIKGNGTILGETSGSFILNFGNLETDNITLIGNQGGNISNTIMNEGTFTANNSMINGITSYATVTINEGEYGKILAGGTGEGSYEINNATIESISLETGGTVNINGGTIKYISLADDSGSIHLTIGNLDEPVSSTNPVIEEMYFRTDLAGCFSTGGVEINFYNGIVKKYYGMTELLNNYFYTNLRPGYKAQTIAEGTILVK